MENPWAIDVVGLELEMKKVRVGDVPFGGFIDRLVEKSGLLTDRPRTYSGSTTYGSIKV